LHELLVLLISVQVLEKVEIADLALVLSKGYRGKGCIKGVIGRGWEGDRGEGKRNRRDFAAELGGGEGQEIVGCADQV
jgi:hypothetical protein